MSSAGHAALLGERRYVVLRVDEGTCPVRGGESRWIF